MLIVLENPLRRQLCKTPASVEIVFSNRILGAQPPSAVEALDHRSSFFNKTSQQDLT